MLARFGRVRNIHHMPPIDRLRCLISLARFYVASGEVNPSNPRNFTTLIHFGPANILYKAFEVKEQVSRIPVYWRNRMLTASLTTGPTFMPKTFGNPHVGLSGCSHDWRNARRRHCGLSPPRRNLRSDQYHQIDQDRYQNTEPKVCHVTSTESEAESSTKEEPIASGRGTMSWSNEVCCASCQYLAVHRSCFETFRG